MEHEKFMRRAIELAREALEAGEIPVGCVIVRGGEIIAEGRNTRESSRSVLGHAELNAIDAACRALGDWRLEDCAMYVTLEPCPMCAGAIINARLPRLFYGARDERMGACAGVLNIFEENFGHRPAIVAGVSAEDCRELLSAFFRRLRTER